MLFNSKQIIMGNIFNSENHGLEYIKAGNNYQEDV